MFNSFKEYRCKYCNKLFFKGDLKYCTIEIKCKKCRKFSEVKGLNCRLLLFSDQQAFYKRDNEISSSGRVTSIKHHTSIDQCSGCEETDNCKYYKTIMRKTA